MSVVAENAPTVQSVKRYWCFTWFPVKGLVPMCQLGAGETGDAIRVEKYGPDAIKSGCNWPLCEVGEGKDILGLVFQKEVCPETGREHIQGYAEFAKPCRFNYAQGALGVANAHCEARKTTREQCVTYCSKTETRAENTVPVFLGTLASLQQTAVAEYKGRQGKRTDISGMVELIKGGKRAIDQLEHDPETFVKFSRGFAEVRRIVQQAAAKQMRDVRTTVYWGQAGAGKTRKVYDNEGLENVFTLVADNGGCWFDGYEGEPVLLIDDFKGWITHTLLLKILDRYPLRCPVKGSFTYAAWTRVYITSNYDPKSWYGADCDWAALNRRLHEIKQFGEVHAVASAGAGAGAAAAHAPGFFTPIARANTTVYQPRPKRPLIDSDDEDLSDDDDDSA